MGDGVEMMKAGVPTLDLVAVFTWFPVETLNSRLEPVSSGIGEMPLLPF